MAVAKSNNVASKEPTKTYKKGESKENSQIKKTKQKAPEQKLKQ